MVHEKKITDVESQDFPEVIEMLLQKRGINKIQFAQDIGMSRNTVNQTLKGERVLSSYEAQRFFSHLTTTAEERALLRRALVSKYLGEWADEVMEERAKETNTTGVLR